MSVGLPDPPSDLGYNSAEVIETSVDLQWTRPSYTGGVSVRSYRVSVNGRTETMEDNKDRVQYSPGLVYGEVLVSVINTCGQESQPGAIHIPARGSHMALTLFKKVAIYGLVKLSSIPITTL